MAMGNGRFETSITDIDTYGLTGAVLLGLLRKRIKDAGGSVHLDAHHVDEIIQLLNIADGQAGFDLIIEVLHGQNEFRCEKRAGGYFLYPSKPVQVAQPWQPSRSTIMNLRDFGLTPSLIEMALAEFNQELPENRKNDRAFEKHAVQFVPQKTFSPDWRPSANAVEDLVGRGVSADFVDRCCAEFVFYHTESQTQRRVTNADFLRFTLSRWQKEKSLIRDAASYMQSSWHPGKTAVETLIKKGISETFIAEQLPEFVLYWKDRGERSPNWDTKFVQRVAAQWQRLRAFRSPPNQSGQSTRSVSLLDQLTDTSWADEYRLAGRSAQK